MTQLPKETQKNGDTNKSKRTNKHAPMYEAFTNAVEEVPNYSDVLPFASKERKCTFS